jgi:hypothetical protein
MITEYVVYCNKTTESRHLINTEREFTQDQYKYKRTN